MARAKGSTTPAARKNNALLFAVMYHKGPIVDARGYSMAVLFKYMKLNGCTFKHQTSLAARMKTFDSCFEFERRGKRTYKIDLVDIPSEFDPDVEYYRDKLVWTGTVAEVTPDPKPTPVVTPPPTPVSPTEVPTAAAIADQVLNLLVDRLTAKPSPPSATDPDTPRLLIEANAKQRKLQDAYNNLKNDHDRLVTKTNRQEAELVRLRENVRILQEESQRGVGHEVGKAVDRTMRQAPGGTKGCDGVDSHG